MDHIIAIQKLIDILLDTRTKISEINGLPDAFKTRAERTITILANSSAHTIGQTVEEIEGVQQMEFPPITEFMGKPIQVSEVPMNKKVDPDVLDNYRKKIGEIVDSLADLTPKEFYDKHTESEIRGVAKQLGIAVTTTDPEVITMEFINSIYTAFELKLQHDKLKVDVENGKKEMNATGPTREDLINELVELVKGETTAFTSTQEEELRSSLAPITDEDIKGAIASYEDNMSLMGFIKAKSLEVIASNSTAKGSTPATKATPAPATPKPNQRSRNTPVK